MSNNQDNPTKASGLHQYNWDNSAAPCSQSYINPLILSLLKRESVGKILDLGCGNSALCRLMHSHGFDEVGMEPDHGGVCISREQLPVASFYHLGVDDDPFVITSSEGLFDAVVSTEVIEHLYSPHLLPRFAKSCLKPGGLFILSTPYHGYLKNLLLSLTGKWDDHHRALEHGGHIKFLSRATLTRLLVDEGFASEALIGAGRLPWLWKSMILVMRNPW